MRKAHRLLGCILLALCTTLLQSAPATWAAAESAQASQGVSRKVSVIDLKSIKPLKEAFARDAGKVRVVALVSPT